MMAQDSSDETGIVTDALRDKEVIRARDRKANAALQMSIAGATWDEIAEVLGFPTGRAARVATEKALEKELRSTSKEQMIVMAEKRLERLMRAVWPKAMDKDSPEQMVAVGKARELIADHRKLHGLDRPTEITVSSPAQQEIEAWVATVTRHNAPELEEADVFEEEYDVIEGQVIEDAAQAE